MAATRLSLIGTPEPTATSRAAVAGSLRGRARIANDSAVGFAVYVGYDALPDFTAERDGFAAAKPVEFAIVPPLAGTSDLYVVLREVNKYGVESQNQQTKTITIDTNGDEVLGPVSAPESLVVQTTIDDFFQVLMTYPGILTDANPADTWRLYVGQGAAPTPGVDVPVATGSALEYGVAVVGPYPTGGVTYHFAVTVYRTEDATESAALTEELVLGADPDTPVSV